MLIVIGAHSFCLEWFPAPATFRRPFRPRNIGLVSAFSTMGSDSVIASGICVECGSRQDLLTTRTQFLNIGVDWQSVVQRNMVRRWHQSEILKAIVRSVSVYVVNVLARIQRSADSLFHHGPVFFKLAPASHADDSVSHGVQISGTLRALENDRGIAVSAPTHVMPGTQISRNGRLSASIDPTYFLAMTDQNHIRVSASSPAVVMSFAIASRKMGSGATND
jgi:hypothetical protein